MKTYRATLQVQEGTPKFCKAQPVPFVIKDAIRVELDRLEAAGIIEGLSYSKWAAPIVAVPIGTVCSESEAIILSWTSINIYFQTSPHVFYTCSGMKFSY